MRGGLFIPPRPYSIIITVTSEVLLLIVITSNFNSSAFPCRGSLFTESRWGDASNIPRSRTCLIPPKQTPTNIGMHLAFLGAHQQMPRNIFVLFCILMLKEQRKWCERETQSAGGKLLYPFHPCSSIITVTSAVVLLLLIIIIIVIFVLNVLGFRFAT
jgi:hypothetical protein